MNTQVLVDESLIDSRFQNNKKVFFFLLSRSTSYRNLTCTTDRREVCAPSRQQQHFVRFIHSSILHEPIRIISLLTCFVRHIASLHFTGSTDTDSSFVKNTYTGYLGTEYVNLYLLVFLFVFWHRKVGGIIFRKRSDCAQCGPMICD